MTPYPVIRPLAQSDPRNNKNVDRVSLCEVEEDTEELDDEQKAKRKEENDKYFMGYFNWHWTRNGFWTTLWTFYGTYLRNNIWWQIFSSIGSAFGAGIARRFILKEE